MTQTPEDRLAYLGFTLITPRPVLRPYVQSYWHLCRATPLAIPHEEFLHPGGGFGIVFNFGDALCLDGQAFAEPVFLDGTNTMTRKLGFQGKVEQIGVRFYPGGAYPFIGIPLAELQNQVALLDVLNPSLLMQLYFRLYEVKSLSVRVNLLEEWLIARLRLGKRRHPLIPASLVRLRAGSPPSLSIPDLAQEFAISQRQLERLYRTQVGMSPRQYVQLLRVEKARLALKQMGGKTNARLAVELGFYDQPHFIREFKAVIGMTPYRYMTRHLKTL